MKIIIETQEFDSYVCAWETANLIGYTVQYQKEIIEALKPYRGDFPDVEVVEVWGTPITLDLSRVSDGSRRSYTTVYARERGGRGAKVEIKDWR